MAAGKAAAGTIAVVFRREGDGVRVTVRDDGGGIDLDALLLRARGSGAIGAADLVGMSAAEQARLVFLPGLTTATAVTALSGRGIGLDVVHSAVTELGGAIGLTTAFGEGTMFDLWVPLSEPADAGREQEPTTPQRSAAAPRAA
jgi:chemotaxis protein histidine kinase CheA